MYPFRTALDPFQEDKNQYSTISNRVTSFKYDDGYARSTIIVYHFSSTIMGRRFSRIIGD